MPTEGKSILIVAEGMQSKFPDKITKHLAAVNLLKHLREIFDDWLTRAAGVIFVLIVALVIFNVTSGLYQTHPLLGLFAFSLVPILFFAGGVVFILAILRSGR